MTINQNKPNKNTQGLLEKYFFSQYQWVALVGKYVNFVKDLSDNKNKWKKMKNEQIIFLLRRLTIVLKILGGWWEADKKV